MISSEIHYILFPVPLVNLHKVPVVVSFSAECTSRSELFFWSCKDVLELMPVLLLLCNLTLQKVKAMIVKRKEEMLKKLMQKAQYAFKYANKNKTTEIER